MISKAEKFQLKEKLHSKTLSLSDLKSYLQILAERFNNDSTCREYTKNFRAIVYFTLESDTDFWLKFYKGTCEFGFGEPRDNMFQKIFKHYVELSAEELIHLIIHQEALIKNAKTNEVVSNLDSEKLQRIFQTFEMTNRYLLELN